MGGGGSHALARVTNGFIHGGMSNTGSCSFYVARGDTWTLRIKGAKMQHTEITCEISGNSGYI